jgi:hypothetical protein
MHAPETSQVEAIVKEDAGGRAARADPHPVSVLVDGGGVGKGKKPQVCEVATHTSFTLPSTTF